MQALAELDDLIASECVFCGDLMIRSLIKEYDYIVDSFLFLQEY